LGANRDGQGTHSVGKYAPRRIGTRIGLLMVGTLVGTSLGSWLSGEVLDLLGSLRAAFVNGVVWRLVNPSVVVWLLRRGRPSAVAA
jgi:hypothetical protein